MCDVFIGKEQLVCSWTVSGQRRSEGLHAGPVQGELPW